MTARRTLWVPIGLDALWLREEMVVSSPTADFARLPWRGADRDHGSDRPYLYSSVVNGPFSSDLVLKPGVHMHWSMPAALARSFTERGQANEAETKNDEALKRSFPALPDRFMVITGRRERDQQGVWRFQRDPAVQIVESTYLAAPGTVPQGQGARPIAFPVRDAGHGEPPYRYIGCVRNEEAYKKKPRDGDYLDELTIMGWGEPSFASFYPNCHAVFGYFDDKPCEDGTIYLVAGWYSDPSKDFVRSEHVKRAIAVRKSAHARANHGALPTNEQLLREVLADYLGWNIKAHPGVEDRRYVTEQRGILGFLPSDAGIGAKFQELRHTRGFEAHDGGRIWTIRSRTGAKDATPGSLPEPVVEALHALNAAQRAFDRQRWILVSRRRRLYAGLVLVPVDDLSIAPGNPRPSGNRGDADLSRS